MNPSKLANRAAFVCLILALLLLSAASGVLVRDIGARTEISASGPLPSLSRHAQRFYAYELTYEIAIFSTVRVNTTIEALFGGLYAQYESNGSFLTTFRPRFPGVHQVTIRNLEDRGGNIGVTILQRNTLPPDVEASLIHPLLYGTLILFLASVAAFAVGIRGPPQYGRPTRTTEALSKSRSHE